MPETESSYTKVTQQVSSRGRVEAWPPSSSPCDISTGHLGENYQRVSPHHPGCPVSRSPGCKLGKVFILSNTSLYRPQITGGPWR